MDTLVREMLGEINSFFIAGCLEACVLFNNTQCECLNGGLYSAAQIYLTMKPFKGHLAGAVLQENVKFYISVLP